MSLARTLDLRSWLDGFVHDARFLERYPHYTYVLASLEPVLDPSVPLMGVSLHGASGRGARYYLHVNVDAVAREPQYLRGLLLHEVHHIVLGHLSHPKFFVSEQRDLMQIAQETSANEFIEEALPEPILWQHFERLGLRAKQSTYERYELLRAARAEGKEPQLARDTKFVDEHIWRDLQAPHPAGLNETRQILEHARDQAPSHDKVAAEQGKLAGRTPEQLLAQLGATAGRPEVEVDWRDALRQFVAQARAPQHTWSRPSRRFPARIGEIPGRSYQHRTVLRPSLIVAIDTSLSITDTELAEIARHLRILSELAQLHVVECDTTITRTYPFRGTLDQVLGRGGTDLRPVFAPSFLSSRHADGVVYFTDGEGPYPERAPALPVLWALTKPNAFACPWGARAKLTLAGKPSRRK
jgi:predicted metal-dependent peptidase